MVSKIIVFDEKEHIIEQIRGYLGGSLTHRLHIENYLYKQDVSFLKVYLSRLKPFKDNIIHLPKQTILMNKDIIYNALCRVNADFYEKAQAKIKEGIRLTKYPISKNRLRKILRYNKPLFKKEKIRLSLYLKHLQANPKKRVKDVRQNLGLRYTTLINNELRTIIVNSSYYGKLLTKLGRGTENIWFNRAITKDVKRQRIERIEAERLKKS